MTDPTPATTTHELPGGAMRPSQAAAFCGLSLRTFNRWRRELRVPAPMVREVRADGRPTIVLWSRDELQAWIEGGMAAPTAASRRRRGGTR